jgi:hypothetical protein
VRSPHPRRRWWRMESSGRRRGVESTLVGGRPRSPPRTRCQGLAAEQARLQPKGWGCGSERMEGVWDPPVGARGHGSASRTPRGRTTGGRRCPYDLLGVETRCMPVRCYGHQNMYNAIRITFNKRKCPYIATGSKKLYCNA